MRVALLVLVLSSLAAAQIPAPQSNVVTFTVSPDGGGLTWYVDVRGIDTNTCTAPFTDGGRKGPCRQPQAAVDKIPKLLRHGATVSIDAGVYAAFVISGFTVDTGVQQANSGILIDGSLALSVLDGGSATGTATSGSAGTGATFGTLSMTGAGWIGDGGVFGSDLTGRFVSTTSPTNVMLPIRSNTSDTLTVVGTWSAPTGATSFSIFDPSVEIVGAVPLPPTGTVVGGNNSAVIIDGNLLNHALEGVVLRNLRLSPGDGGTTLFTGVTVTDVSSVMLTQLQIRPLGTFPIGVSVGPATGAPLVRLLKVDILSGSFNPAILVSFMKLRLGNVLMRNTVDTSQAISASGWFGLTASISASEMFGFRDGLALLTGIGGSGGGNSALLNSRITCGSSSGVGIRVGSSTTTNMGAPANLSSISTTDVSVCGTALQVVGPATADVISMSGAAGTTGFAAYLGAVIAYTKASVTLTAPTEISLDPASIVPVVSTFAAVAANSCIATAAAGYYSRACAR